MSERIINLIQRWIFPASDCLLCLGKVTFYKNKAPIICLNCHQHLNLAQYACPVCALPLPAPGPLTSSIITSCGTCLKQSPPYTKTVSAFQYETPISDLITHLKFYKKLQLLPILCDYLAEKIRDDYQKDPLPTLLIPVPLHPSRLKQRGFNQAQLICRRLSSILNIKMNTHTVTRIRQTLPQSQLNATERRHNLKDAFQVNQQNDKHVAIIDDVMTTGTTVSELAKQLRLSGYSRVDVWIAARAYDGV